MAFLDLKIDSDSTLASKFQGKYFAKNNNHYTLEEISEVDAKTGKMLENLSRVFYPEPLANTEERFEPVMVSAKQGAFDRIYGPIVVKHEGKMCLSAGLVHTPLDIKKGLIPHPGLEIEVTIESSTFNGYDDTPVLSLTIFRPNETNPEEGLTLAYEFPIKFRKLQEGEAYPTVKEMAATLKRKPQDLLAWLGDPPKPSLPTVASKQLPPDEYQVIDFDFFTLKDGRETGTLTIKGNVDESGLLTQEYIDPDDDSRETYIPLEVIQVWMPTKLFGTLKLSPVVSEEFPASYTVHSVKPGKKAGSFRVDDGFMLNQDAPQVTEEEEDLSYLEL